MGDAIPENYKAAIYDNPGTISTQVVEKDVPEPAAGDVLIKLQVHLMFFFDFWLETRDVRA